MESLSFARISSRLHGVLCRISKSSASAVCILSSRHLIRTDNDLDGLPDLSLNRALEVISVVDNKLTMLPAWIGKLPALRELSCSNNDIKCVVMVTHCVV